MFERVKAFVKKQKAKLGALAVGAAALAAPSFAGAAGMTDVETSVATEMGKIQTTALTVLGSVAAVAIVLFGAIYAWRYGKKLFSIISK